MTMPKNTLIIEHHYHRSHYPSLHPQSPLPLYNPPPIYNPNPQFLTPLPQSLNQHPPPHSKLTVRYQLDQPY